MIVSNCDGQLDKRINIFKCYIPVLGVVMVAVSAVCVSHSTLLETELRTFKTWKARPSLPSTMVVVSSGNRPDQARIPAG